MVLYRSSATEDGSERLQTAQKEVFTTSAGAREAGFRASGSRSWSGFQAVMREPQYWAKLARASSVSWSRDGASGIQNRAWEWPEPRACHSNRSHESVKPSSGRRTCFVKACKRSTK